MTTSEVYVMVGLCV